MAFKDVVSNGENFTVTQSDRSYGGKSITALAVDGSSGKVTMEGKDLSAVFKASGFTGHSGAGSCTLAAAAVGDVVIGVVNLAGGDAASSFESVISVAGHIQQSSASDLSSANFMVLLLKRGVGLL